MEIYLKNRKRESEYKQRTGILNKILKNWPSLQEKDDIHGIKKEQGQINASVVPFVIIALAIATSQAMG